MCNMKWVFSRSKHRLLTRIFAYIIYTMYVFLFAPGPGSAYFVKNDWYKAMGWCTHKGSQLLVGDFNGDGRADMLCHDNRGTKWIALANRAGRFTGTSWHKAMGWCSHAGSMLFVGDFNGDGRSDMLCHDSKGSKWVALADIHGRFSGTTWHNSALRWCGHQGAHLLIGDFNGDGRSDMMCYDRSHKWVSLAALGGDVCRHFVGQGRRMV